MLTIKAPPPQNGYRLSSLADQTRAQWGVLVAGKPNEHNNGELLNFYFVDNAGVTLGDVITFLASHDAAQLSAAEQKAATKNDARANLQSVDLTTLRAKGGDSTILADMIEAMGLQ